MRCADLRKRTSPTSETALGGRGSLYANRARCARSTAQYSRCYLLPRATASRPVTAGITAGTRRSEPVHYAACLALLEGPLVTTATVIAEAAYLIDRQLGAKPEASLHASIVEGHPTRGSTHDRLIAVRQQRDLPVVSVYHH